MCGIAGLFGAGWTAMQLDAMVAHQRHRGPDAQGIWCDPRGSAALGHDRLSIVELSAAGAQPMASADGRYVIAFNGEIYNHPELRAELSPYPFRGRSDTEVIVAAFARWGEHCLERFVGMFALLIWDVHARALFAARDRFGVKPLYYHVTPGGHLAAASEIGALHAAGVARDADPVAWATYLRHGTHDGSARTFWEGVRSLPAGHLLRWRDGRCQVACWYDLAARVGADLDARPAAVVEAEYLALLEESVRLRLRSDVPVGINLSGGVDSSLLLGLVQAVQPDEREIAAFTFVTGDPSYDELPWVQRALARTRHPLVVCRLHPEDVPSLATSVQTHQGEPFGGVPTLAYARIFETARGRGTVVLLDGQGLDEQWAGYDYYREAGAAVSAAPAVQGAATSPVRPECLTPEFAALAEPFQAARPFGDALRDLQYRDATATKIPRVLRYNDRISMRASTELREPFLDHRLFELALRQPRERKIHGVTGKWMLRRIARQVVPRDVITAPKRALQTPQREWLRGPLREWCNALVEAALQHNAWLDAGAVRRAWGEFLRGEADNSFFVWQWISLSLAREVTPVVHGGRAPGPSLRRMARAGLP